MALFKIDHLSYRYPGGKAAALSDVNLDIVEGECVLLIGPSGGGKTTLARFLSGFIPEFYGGRIQGEIFFQGRSLFQTAPKDIRAQIGMVFQDPEKQIIMGEVERDLVLGLENLGLSANLMQRRLTEILNFLGLTELRHRRTFELSSGEKQKVAIGSILAMLPRVLILDEPTSQLDPARAQECMAIIERLQREQGFTIILIEQRLEHCLPFADRVVLLDQGKIIFNEKPTHFPPCALEQYEDFIPLIPRLFAQSDQKDVPLTVSQGRDVLRNILKGKEVLTSDSQTFKNSTPFLKLEQIHFIYPAGIAPVLEEIQLNVSRQEAVVILGENGAGKSTLLKLIAGVFKPTRGKILFEGKNINALTSGKRAQKIAYLSQNPNDYLFNDTLEEELLFTMKHLGINDEERIASILDSLEMGRYRHFYPRDLSAGERQRAALASILVAHPELLLLDEPTRGMDGRLKKELLLLLRNLMNQYGMSVVLITQDVEFAADFADRVILLSQGKIIEEGSPRQVLSGNLFYSTAVNKLFRGMVEGVVHFEEAKKLLGRNGHE